MYVVMIVVRFERAVASKYVWKLRICQLTSLNDGILTGDCEFLKYCAVHRIEFSLCKLQSVRIKKIPMTYAAWEVTCCITIRLKNIVLVLI
jgi:hypothetical protein